MHLIDTPSASGNSFVDGTIADDDWLNMLQEEPAAVAEWLGMRLPGPDAQLLEALRGHAHGIGVRNELINGDFSFWGRGSSFTSITSPTHVAERWIADPLDGEYDVERVAFDQGSAPTDLQGALSFLRWITSTEAVTGHPRILQRVEDVRRLAGARVAISGWARVDSASAVTFVALRAVFRQHFGAGGSSAVETSPESMGTVDDDDTWTRFTLETTVPALGAVTIDGAGYTEIQLRISGDAIVDLADVMVERVRGAPVLRYDRIPHAWEYRRAARYYQKSYLGLTDPGSVAPDGALTGAYHLDTDPFVEHARELDARFAVPMRATPSVTWYSPNAGDVGMIDVLPTTFPYPNPVTSTLRTSPESTGYPVVSLPIGPGPDGIVGVAAHFTADAEL